MDHFKLTTKIALTEKNLGRSNLASLLPEEDREALARHIKEGYDRDERSRERWKLRMQASMDLALQITAGKNFPWPGCANVAFPLVTIAALQFHSRAYPVLLQGPEIVRAAIPSGNDDPQVVKNAMLVSRHMSWQRLEEDQPWEEQADRALLCLPIMGCIFKKVYNDGRTGINRSSLVLPQHLVVNYFAKSIESARRKTHLVPMYRNEIYEGIMQEVYCDIREEDWFNTIPSVPEQQSEQQGRTDKRTGMQPPQADETTPYMLLEQHVWLDLDQDGYEEPYIALVEGANECLLRLLPRFTYHDITFNGRHEVVRIMAEEHFVKHSFIPSPDGGIYDLGFGSLLGPNNEAVNSIFNQLLDAGTLANTAGGFLARGAKIRGGVYTFSPFSWNRVDSTGDDLKKSIFPMPTREPSAVLLNLLKLLIDYTDRISGTTEAMVGENVGQNTPAETSRNMVEQGMKIYAAVFKRVWRGYKAEFERLYMLNGRHLQGRMRFGGPEDMVSRDLYLGNPADICPEADPNLSSDAMGVHQAEWLKQDIMRTPGGYDIEAVTRFAHRKLRIPNSDQLFPGLEKKPPTPNPKVIVEQIKMQAKQQALQAKLQETALKLQAEEGLNQAKAMESIAKASLAAAQAQGIDKGHQIDLLNALINAENLRQTQSSKHIEHILKLAELMHGEPAIGSEESGTRGIRGMDASTLHEAASHVLGSPGAGNQGPMGRG